MRNQVAATLNSNRASNSKFGSKRKFTEEVRTSQSKNQDTAKKSSKKKNTGGGLDKESRDQLKSIESKIDDLRKQAFNEINRLEAMME